MREASQRANRGKAKTETERAPSDTTLRRLQARGERLLQWFPELRKTWQRDAEPSLEALLGQLQALGGKVSRRAQETGRDLEARAERVIAELERQALRGIGPLLSRAHLASSAELGELTGRLEGLEAALQSAGEGQVRLGTGLDHVRKTLDEARAEATERLRDVSMRLSAGEELRDDFGRLHTHVDALSKDQVARSLEIGKLHDRLVRLEMRMGDFVKEQATQLVAQQEAGGHLAALAHRLDEATAGMQAAVRQYERLAAAGQATDARLAEVSVARRIDRDEVGRLADVLTSVQQALRQVDLRLGDLAERQTAVREEVAALSARVSHLELAATQPVSATLLAGRTEGH